MALSQSGLSNVGQREVLGVDIGTSVVGFLVMRASPSS
jgi:hypothetical protein